jgi:hypothetical protein
MRENHARERKNSQQNEKSVNVVSLLGLGRVGQQHHHDRKRIGTCLPHVSMNNVLGIGNSGEPESRDKL